jgi:periplasmic protein TonB
MKKSENTPQLIYLSNKKDSELTKKSRIKPKEDLKKPKPKQIIKTNIDTKIDKKIDVKPLKIVQNIDVSTKDFLGAPKINISQNILDANTLQASRKVNPKYPRRAKLRGKEGYVRLQFTILTNGKVTNAKVIESKPDDSFDEAALKAIYKWRFKVDKDGISKVATIKFNFRLLR